MQLFYKPVGGAAYTLLYDEAAAQQYSVFDPAASGPLAMPEWHPGWRPNVQDESLFTVPGTRTGRFRQGLDNSETTVRVALDTPYSSRAAALASLRTWAGISNTLVHFQVVQDTETQYYPNAIITDYDGNVHGIATLHSFTFISDLVTLNAP